MPPGVTATDSAFEKLRILPNIIRPAGLPRGGDPLLHLIPLGAPAKGLSKAARKCRRETVPKESRRFIYIEVF